MSRRTHVIAAVLGAAVATLLTLATPGRAQDAAVTTWMRSHAKPFATCEPGDRTDDLASLRAIVGNARIVALGEGTHGTREFLQLKHRITQYLATNMGFTVFAIEANLPEAWRLNDYVLGGPGDPRQLIAGMYIWTWDTEEVLAMVEWMRAFNASGRGRIEFTGFDMQTPDTAYVIARRWLLDHDRAWADSVTIAPQVRPEDPGFVTSTGELPAAEFAGHHVRYSGWMRTRDVSEFAGLWMRADSSRKPVAFDNMQKRAVKGTTDWQRVAIELDIPPSTDNINWGVLMAAQGTAWFDSLAIEVDGKPWHSDAIDLDMDAKGHPRGLGGRAWHPRFSIAMDDSVAKCGARSLRLAGGPPAAEERDDSRNAGAVGRLRRLTSHLEALRDTPPEGTTRAQVDWIARNVHVLTQNGVLGGRRDGFAVRDSSMAANLEWIADEARRGAKVVIWAHNGHVSRRSGWMGAWLDRRYGRDMVVIGFAANTGRYTAVSGPELTNDNELVEGPPGSVEAMAHATGLPRFLLDLREARRAPAVAKALGGARMRSIGAVAMAEQFSDARALEWFDVLAWIDQTTASRPLNDTKRKLRED